MKPATQRFAVFGPVDDDDCHWGAYTLWFNESWPGFRGWFEGEGDTRPRRLADAIRKAKAADAVVSINARMRKAHEHQRGED